MKAPDGDREQAKKCGALFCASDKLENLVLRYQASEGTVMPSCLREENKVQYNENEEKRHRGAVFQP